MLRQLIKKAAAIIGIHRTATIIKANIELISNGTTLKGKKIIVTGGTKGIGLALAKKFIKEGATVLISGRDKIATETIAREIGAYGLPLDLNDEDNIQIFLDSANQKYGTFDCLVNNAGISLHERTFWDVTSDSFDVQYRTNLKGPFFLTQKFSESLISNKTKGSILFISSETGSTADIRPYGIFKAALNSFVKGLAYLLSQNNIRVNALAPGVVATSMTGYDPNNNLAYPHNSIGRLYLPEEIAEIAAFILSDASECIAGQIIECNNANTVNARWK